MCADARTNAGHALGVTTATQVSLAEQGRVPVAPASARAGGSTLRPEAPAFRGPALLMPPPRRLPANHAPRPHGPVAGPGPGTVGKGAVKGQVKPAVRAPAKAFGSKFVGSPPPLRPPAAVAVPPAPPPPRPVAAPAGRPEAPRPAGPRPPPGWLSDALFESAYASAEALPVGPLAAAMAEARLDDAFALLVAAQRRGTRVHPQHFDRLVAAYVQRRETPALVACATRLGAEDLSQKLLEAVYVAQLEEVGKAHTEPALRAIWAELVRTHCATLPLYNAALGACVALGARDLGAELWRTMEANGVEADATSYLRHLELHASEAAFALHDLADHVRTLLQEGVVVDEPLAAYLLRRYAAGDGLEVCLGLLAQQEVMASNAVRLLVVELVLGQNNYLAAAEMAQELRQEAPSCTKLHRRATALLRAAAAAAARCGPLVPRLATLAESAEV